jgi:hypothetical protein
MHVRLDLEPLDEGSRIHDERSRIHDEGSGIRD